MQMIDTDLYTIYAFKVSWAKGVSSEDNYCAGYQSMQWNAI